MLLDFYLSEHPTKIYKKILSNTEILDLDFLNYNNRDKGSATQINLLLLLIL